MVGRIFCSIGRTPCFVMILGGGCAYTIVGIIINKLAKQMSERKRQKFFARTTLFNIIICICVICQNISSFLVKIVDID